MQYLWNILRGELIDFVDNVEYAMGGPLAANIALHFVKNQKKYEMIKVRFSRALCV